MPDPTIPTVDLPSDAEHTTCPHCSGELILVPSERKTMHSLPACAPYMETMAEASCEGLIALVDDPSAARSHRRAAIDMEKFSKDLFAMLDPYERHQGPHMVASALLAATVANCVALGFDAEWLSKAVADCERQTRADMAQAIRDGKKE